MTKLEYFLLGLNNSSYLFKGWIIDMFGVVELDLLPQGPYKLYSQMDEDDLLHMPYRGEDEPDCFTCEQYPFQLFVREVNGKREVGYLSRYEDQVGEFHRVPDLDALLANRQAFYKFGDAFDLPDGSVRNQTGAINVSYGELLVNQIIKVYPFGDMFPLTTGTFNLKDFENEFAPLITSVSTAADFVRDPKLIYTDTIEQKYYPAAFSISGWTMLSVPAATEYTIDVSPEMRKLRKRLLEENIDKLDDPVVVANIVKELVQADMEWQAQDPDKGFLQPGKAFDVVRAKAYLIHGLDYDFDDRSKVHLIERSLSEQWDPRDIKRYVNALIDGSYNRGFDTALGGELAKIIIRFFLTCTVNTEDCGIRFGRGYAVNKGNAANFTGRYIFEGAKEVLITAETVNSYVGKVIQARTPAYCHAPDGGFCVHCMGKEFEHRRGRLVAHASEMGNIILYVMMSRMHGRALKTVNMNWKSLR